MFRIKFFLFPAFILLMFSSCSNEKATEKDLLSEIIIPYPDSISASGSSFRIKDKTPIFYQQGDSEFNNNAQFLANMLQPATGFELN